MSIYDKNGIFLASPVVFGLLLGLGIAVALQVRDRRDATPLSFAEMMNKGFEVDYDPLTSPGAAVDKADAIAVVEFTAESSRGVQEFNPGRPGVHVIVEVVVERVIKGDVIPVAIQVSPGVAFSDVEKSVPGGHRAILILDNLSDWRPRGTLSGFPELASAFAPYTDGIWFEGENGELLGVRATPQELESRWGAVASFASLVGVLEGAAGKP